MNSSHSVTQVFSLTSLLTLFSWNLQSDNSECIETYDDKGNILRKRLETSFLTNCFVIGEFISQSYTFVFFEQFGNTVFMKSAKGYSGSLRVQRRKRKYLQVKTWEKLSEKLLCEVCIHLIELNISIEGALRHHCFCGVWEGIFGSALKPMVEKEISQG